MKPCLLLKLSNQFKKMSICLINPLIFILQTSTLKRHRYSIVRYEVIELTSRQSKSQPDF